jgi:hypothetical protein
MSSVVDFPRTWKFDEDGLEVTGAYLKTDRGPTQYGQKAILVLEVNGELRGVWVNSETLRLRLAEELESRGARDFIVGEQIVISRAPEKKTSESGRGYWPFKVRFPDAAGNDAADLLGAHVPRTAAEGGDSGDGDIPF